MVLIVDGNSEIYKHVFSSLGIICLDWQQLQFEIMLKKRPDFLQKTCTNCSELPIDKYHACNGVRINNLQVRKKITDIWLKNPGENDIVFLPQKCLELSCQHK